MADSVRAAGGIVHRLRSDGTVEVAIVHRPKYDDWTLPKGKLDPGESDEEGALREVEEETGLRCEIERRVGEVSYRDKRRRPKKVVYFAMHPVEGEFRPNNEVDQLLWLPAPAAIEALSYDRDRRVVAGMTDTSPL